MKMFIIHGRSNWMSGEITLPTHKEPEMNSEYICDIPLPTPIINYDRKVLMNRVLNHLENRNQNVFPFFPMTL